MKLIEPLASGIAGAEDGTVAITKRGTATYATVYTTFEGTTTAGASTASTPTAPLALDGYGGRIVYVNELVDCKVYDSTGVLRRTFTAGDSAPAVEVRSTAFTGTDYITAATGASKPTTLQAVLDKWLVSAGAGALDWNVLFGGVSTSIKNALGAVGGMFFNVKGAPYGALGDGVNDDTTAIQAAITAAQVAGGIVFFPPGIYKTTSALSVTGASVTFMGAGAAASSILIDHASNNLFTFSGSAAVATFQGLTLGPKQGSSGTMLNVTVSMTMRIDSCLIGGLLLTTGIGLSCNTAESTVVVCIGCIFQLGGAGQFIVTSKGMAACYATRFVFPATAYGVTAWSATKGAIAVGCWFEAVPVTSGAFTSIAFGATATLRQNIVIGCEFTNPTGGTHTPWSTTATTGLVEFGNLYGSALIQPSPTGLSSDASASLSVLKGREHRKYYQTGTAVSMTLDFNKYGYSVAYPTAAGSMPAVAPVQAGLHAILVVRNGTGAPYTPVLNPAGKAGPTVAIAGAEMAVFHLVSMDIAGNLAWYFINDTNSETIP